MEEELKEYRVLLELGKVIVSEMDLEALFDVVVNRTRVFMDTEGCSVFMLDRVNNQLWSRVSTDLKKNEIRFPADQGIAGWVTQHQEPLLINDAYADPRFYREVDRITDVKTRNILCLPLINRQRACIGTLQVFNKRSGDFTHEDERRIESISHYVTIALENATLYEELKVLNKARERVINHLSHELKTPLAVIRGVLGKIERELEEKQALRLQGTLKRGDRQVERLLDLQNKIDDILNQRPEVEQERILNIIESAADLVDDFKDLGRADQREILGLIAERLRTLFQVEEVQSEHIELAPFLRNAIQDARSAMGRRILTIEEDLDETLSIQMDRRILHLVVSGLLKNAIENTPDEGRIEIHAEDREDRVRIGVTDSGVGITEMNRDLIFGGFFHTVDTEFYSSKRSYAFNAGGAGADLLRMRVLAERFGFSIGFETRRCPHIPTDADLCPGRISQCPAVGHPDDCLTTGGSSFYVDFPHDSRVAGVGYGPGWR
ncbi:MAG: GAF domain-containing sensor histidine kinase [Deltaproteobacteria bacterium]|nr:GAF domain-containing sensor histidine kinase [Deltaproteobacteria bacterium]